MSFQEEVYKKLSEVPRGKITTYKSLAKALNSRAFQAVGTAMKNNKMSYAARGRVGGYSLDKQEMLIPCHRVINSNGKIGNYSAKGGTNKKISLLKSEGIEIINGKIDLNKFEFKF